MRKSLINKLALFVTLTGLTTFSVQANNQINWGSPQGIAGDSDVATNGTLVGTYSPYLIVTGGGSITVNGVTFQSNSVNAVVSGMTNSTAMGVNPSLSDPNYIELMTGASDTPLNTPGQGYLAISNLVVGDSYQIEIWAENAGEAIDQWENFYTLNSSQQSSAVNYDQGGAGQYVIGSFTASNSDVEIYWSEWANNNGIGSAYGQGQINLLQLRKVGTPAPQISVTWGSVQQVSGDADVITNNSTLIGTYSPYLILNPSISSLTVNGVQFQSNTLNAVTSGMTNSTAMGTNQNIADPNYADLLAGASDTPFNTSGKGYILFSNVVPGSQYEIQIWAQNALLGETETYGQWENYWTVSSSDSSGPVNYDNNGDNTGNGLGEYVTGTFIPTLSNSVVQITWNEWCNANGVNSSFGQGQVNLIQLRLLQNPPTFTTQPAFTTYAAKGTNITLTAAVSGSPTLAYQWYETNLTAMTGFAISGATNASLTLSNLVASDNYYLVVTNNYGSTNSLLSSVIVYTSPVITAQFPVAYTNVFTLYAGASPTFSVSALGLTTLGYHWFTNGIPDNAATGSSLTTAGVGIGNVTNYCVITNSYGAATSTVWTASVIADPTNSAGGLAPYPQTVLSLHPVGYWRLNEAGNDDGVFDSGADPGVNDGLVCHDYAGGNDGVYTNLWLGPGQNGYNPLTDPSDTSAQFGESDEGNDFGDSLAYGIAGVNFATPSGSSAAFTVEAWVAGFSGPTYDAGIVTLGWGGGGEEFDLDEGAANHAFRFFMRDAAGNTHGVNSLLQPAGPTTWYHLVAVVDEISNQTVSFYTNGVLCGTASIAAGSGVLNSLNLLGQPNLMTIGSRMSNETTNFDDQFYGNINDVAVFNYPLTASQVANEYDAAGGLIAPYFMPTPPTTGSAAATSTLTVPVTAVGTPPLGYTWTNVTTGVAIASGSATNGSGNVSLNYPNVPLSWNGDQLELTVTNTYGTINTLVTLAISNAVNSQPTNIVFGVANSQLTLSWPADHIGWQLQAQTNSLAAGLGTNWVNVGGSLTTNKMILPMSLTNGSVFYRLVY